MSLTVSLEKLNGLERQLTISAPTTDLPKKIEAELSKIRSTAKIPGFRPGKVPLSLIKTHYEGSVIAQALDTIIQESFVKAVEQEKLTLASRPVVEPVGEYKPGENFSYKAKFEVMPEIKNVGLHGKPIQIYSSTVSDDDVDEAITKLRQRFGATWAAVERKAAKGDQVTMNFDGKLDGEVFQGGSAKDFKLILGSRSMISGFEEGLIGMKKGEKKTISLHFPKNYHANHLSGKPVAFDVELTAIEEPTFAPMDEEFLKKVSEKSTVEELREGIREGLQNELTRAVKNKNQVLVLEKLVELNPIEIPKGLIAEEQERASHKNCQDKNHQHVDLTPEQAKKVVTERLLMSAYMQADPVKVEKAKIDARIEEIAEAYGDVEMVKSYYANTPHLQEQLENELAMDMLIERLLAGAKTDVKNVSRVEFIYEIGA